ncbi:MAG: hypothetical protein V2B18_00625, partial [Pseudomonadota bacterium]
SYVENEPAAVIDGSISLVDEDGDNIQSATIRITGNYCNGQDMLSIHPRHLAPGVTAAWDAMTGTLTLTGSAGPADYEVMLEHIEYANVADDPNTEDRTLTWTVNDGRLDSEARTTTVTVASVNDSPVLTVPGEQRTAQGTTLTISGISVHDVDVNSGTGILEVTLDVDNGTITLSSLTGITFAPGGSNGTGRMTFTGSLGDINAALNDLQFASSAGFSGNALLTLNINDQGNFGGGGTVADTSRAITITVTNVSGSDDDGGQPLRWDPPSMGGNYAEADGGVIRTAPSGFVDAVLAYMTEAMGMQGSLWENWASQMVQSGQWSNFRAYVASALTGEDQESRDQAWEDLFGFIHQRTHKGISIGLGLEEFLARLHELQIGMPDKFHLVFNCASIEIWEWLNALNSPHEGPADFVTDLRTPAFDGSSRGLDAVARTFDMGKPTFLDIFLAGRPDNVPYGVETGNAENAVSGPGNPEAMVFDTNKVSFLDLLNVSP